MGDDVVLNILEELKSAKPLIDDSECDLEMACSVVMDAKTQKPSVCNALETLLVSEEIADSFLPVIGKLLSEKQVAELIDELCQNLASDLAYTPSSLSKFIGLCNYIKSSLLICEIHHNLESDIDEQVCKECENMLLKGPGSVY